MPGGLDQNVLSQDWSTHLADRLDAWFQRGRWGTGQDVFVVYGRNRPARDALFELLRALDLNPLEWSALVRGTGKTLPYVGDVLAHGFATAQACIVLVTGDEVVRLRRAFAEPHESVVAEFQPRPNVLFEAGMALASHPDRTLVVQLGPTRRLSDLAGRLFIEMVDPVAGRRAIADGLRVAGCQVRTDSDTWLESGDFASAIRLAQEAVTELSP